MKRKIISTKMKVFMSIFFTIFISCYLAGIIVLYNSDYRLSDYFDNWDFDFDFDFDWPNYKYSVNDSENIVLEDSVNEINVDCSSLDLDFEFYNDNSIKLELSGSVNKHLNYNDIINTNSSADKVIISTNETFTNFSSNLKLKVYLPNSYKNELIISSTSGDIVLNDGILSNITISSSSSDIYLSSLIATSLNISTSSGDIECIDNVQSENSNIKSSSGDIDYYGKLGNTKVSTSSGEIFLSLSDLSKSSIVETSSGDVEIELSNNLGYIVNFNTSSGDFDFEGEDNYSKSGNNYTFYKGDKSHEINVNTNSGDLEIY